MNSLQEKIQKRESGILLYGLTPPKAQNTVERIRDISERRNRRLSELKPDGVILYDIQDEDSRTRETRPFPFLPTVEPTAYYDEFLPLDIPTIFYQSVGKYALADIQRRIDKHKDQAFVFVGAPSREHRNLTSLPSAYENTKLGRALLGGVTIAERHAKYGNEDERILDKMRKGCSFFVSQCVYDAGQFKDMLSDLYYSCMDRKLAPPTIFLTVSPCGSLSTVELFKWLGVRIPRWIENDLAHSLATLEKSVEYAESIVRDVLGFALEKGIPFGCNIESVSAKKEEVLASFELARRVQTIFAEAGLR